MRLIKLAIKNYLVMFILLGLIALFGTISYLSMPPETFPEIKIPYVFVSTLYLGVSPQDIEALVTDPLEKELKSLKDVKVVESSSYEGFSFINIEFKPNVDVDTALQRVKDKVDLAKTELPTDAEIPVVKELSFSDFPFVYVNLFGNYDLVQLKQIADELKEELEAIEGVLEADVIGGQEREIQVIVSPKKLKEKGLSFNDISQAIAAENINIPGGNLDMGKFRYSIRIPGEFKTLHDLENLIIRYQKGSPIYLKDIAAVLDTFKEQNSFSRFNGESNINLALKKRTGVNLLVTSEAVKKTTNDFIKNNNLKGLNVYFLRDFSDEIRAMIKELQNNIATGFLFVLCVLFIFLGFRNASIVAFAIPISMLISFGVLYWMLDFTLNFMVLYSLVLALGMLVDNAIVVVENIHRFREEGVEVEKAAFKATKQVVYPVVFATLTTLVVFMPLLFWPGMMGKFMGFLPRTLIVTLSASLFVAMFISPVIVAHIRKLILVLLIVGCFGLIIAVCGLYGKFFSFLIGIIITNTIAKNLLVTVFVIASAIGTILLFFALMKNQIKAIGNWCILPDVLSAKRLKKSEIKEDSVYMKKYEQMLRFSLRHPITILIFSFVAFVFVIMIAYPKLGKGFVFFPEVTPTTGYVKVKLPQGSIISETDKITREIGALVPGYSEIKSYNENIGGQIAGFGDGKTNINQSQVIIEFKNRSTDKVSKGFDPEGVLESIRAKVKKIPGAEIEVIKEEGGAPVGPPVSVKISGEDFAMLLKLSKEVQSLIKDVPGIVNLKDDYEEGLPEIVIRLDRKKMSVIGVNTGMVASAIRTAIYGSKVSTLRTGGSGDEYDITLRYPQDSRKNVEDIRNIYITNYRGEAIPLRVFSTIEFGKGVGYLIHNDFERTVQVSSDLAKGANSNEVRAAIAKIIDEKLTLPQGYFINYSGEAEEQQESQQFLVLAGIASLALIFVILVGLFHSLLIPCIVFLSIILSMIGVYVGLIITGTSFSFIMTGVAILSLFGIIVNNGIVLLDYVIILRKSGLDRFSAVIKGGKTRARPVLLTATTTVLGLIPMSTGYSFDFSKFRFAYYPDSAEMWSSMSNPLIFGLIFGTLLTLVVVPSSYYFLDKLKEDIILWLKDKKRPKVKV